MKRKTISLIAFILALGTFVVACSKNSNTPKGPQEVFGTYKGKFTINDKEVNGTLSIHRPGPTTIRVQSFPEGTTIAVMDIVNTKEKIDEINPISEEYAKEHPLVRLLDQNFTTNAKMLQYLIDEKTLTITGLPGKARFTGTKQ